MKTKYIAGKAGSIVLFLTTAIMYIAIYLTKNMFSSAMAVIVEDGVMTKAQTGAIGAAFWMVYALLQLLGGPVFDRVSPSVLICIGIAGGALSNLVIYLNHTYIVVMLAWMFNAFVQAGVWPAVFRIISTEVDPKYRETSIFYILYTSTLGLVASMLVASLVKSWEDNFLICAILLSVVLVLWLLIYTPLRKRMVEVELEAPPDEVKIKSAKTEHSFIGLTLVTGLIGMFAINFLKNCVFSGIQMVTPTMLMESYEGLPAAVSTRLGIILVLAATLGNPLAIFFERYVSGNEIKVMLILSAVCAVPVAVNCFVGVVPYTVLIVLLSFELLIMQTTAVFTTVKAAKRFAYCGKSGTAAGFLNSAAAFANVVASFAFPAIAQYFSWGAVTVIWLVLTLLMLLVCVAFYKRWTHFIEKGPDYM